MGPWQTQDTAPKDGSWFLMLLKVDDSVDAVYARPYAAQWDRNEWTDGESISREPGDKFFWLPIPPYPLPTWQQYQEAKQERERLAREMEAEVQRVKDRIMYGS